MDIISKLQDRVLSYSEDFIAMIPLLGLGFIVAFIFLFIARLIRRRLIGLAKSRAQDPLLLQFLDSVFRIVNFTIGMLLFLYIIGLSGIAGSILGAASISAVVLGFAFKDIGENFIAGVIMAFNRPFNMGDTVKSNEVEGSIRAMTLRHTHIKTFDGKDVYVPNGQILKNPLYNYTIDGFLRKSFIIGIDYASDVEQARSVILKNIEQIPGIVTEDKAPRTHIKDLSSSTLNIEVHYWIDTFDSRYSSFDTHTTAIRSSLEKLNAAGVEMPGDIIEVKNYKDGAFLNQPANN